MKLTTCLLQTLRMNPRNAISTATLIPTGLIHNSTNFTIEIPLKLDSFLDIYKANIFSVRSSVERAYHWNAFNTAKRRLHAYGL